MWRKKVLVRLHFLSNIKINEYFNFESRFNGVYSRDKLPRIKDEAYVKHLVGKQNKGTHWVSLFTDR